MATENRDWGYTRIRGGASTILATRWREAPSPTCSSTRPGTRARTQEAWHLAGVSGGPLGVVAAADFFTVEVWTPRGLTQSHEASFVTHDTSGREPRPIDDETRRRRAQLPGRARGRRNENVAPRSGLLSALMVPVICSMRSRAV